MEAFMNQFVQVQYQNEREGLVDDITLDELIGSKRISHFYRPSENRWVNVIADPVRSRGDTNGTGFFRRASDWIEKDQKKDAAEQKPRRLFSTIFKRHKKHVTPEKEVSAQDWIERGLLALRITNNYREAVRAFALSITVSPFYEEAFVNRGIAYEHLGNLQQAVEDYSRAILVNPSNGRFYYLRGLALSRLWMDEDAIRDLKEAANLHYLPAHIYLRSMDIFV
jgi:hypothetical protein